MFNENLNRRVKFKIEIKILRKIFNFQSRAEENEYKHKRKKNIKRE